VGEAAALISAFCWAGSSVIMARLGVRYGGAVLTGLRFLIAAPFVLLLGLFSGELHQLGEVSPWVWVAMIASAGIGYGIGDTTYVRAMPRIGLQRMSPTVTALWVALSAVGGVLLLNEPIGWDLVIGGTLVVGGTYLIVAGQTERVPDPTGPARMGPLATAGVLLTVAGCWAAATILLAGGRGNLGALAIGALRIPAGGVIISAVALAASRGQVLRRLPTPRDLPLIVVLGIGGTAVGSLLYIYAVAAAGAARAVILTSTSPLMVVPLSMLFLGERLSPRIGLGTGLCLAGTLVVVAGG